MPHPFVLVWVCTKFVCPYASCSDCFIVLCWSWSVVVVVVVECCCCIPYTSSCELHSLKVATGEKEPPDAQTRGLRSNVEFQPRESPMWPRFFVSSRRIYGHGRATILRPPAPEESSVRWCAQRTASMCMCMSLRARDG